MQHLAQILLKEQVELIVLAEKLQREGVFVFGHTDDSQAVSRDRRHGVVVEGNAVMVVRIRRAQAQLFVWGTDRLSQVIHRSRSAYARQLGSQPPTASFHHMALTASTLAPEEVLTVGAITSDGTGRLDTDGAQVGNQRPGFAIFKLVGRHFSARNALSDGPENCRVASTMDPEAGSKIGPAASTARAEAVARRAVGTKQRRAFTDGCGIVCKRILDVCLLSAGRDREGRKANDASGNNEAVAAGECGAAGSGRGIKNARHGNLQTHRVVSALFGRPGLDVQRSGIPGSPGRRLYGLWPPPRVTISSRASQCISSSSRTRSPDRGCVPDGILSSVR